jgi:hypothetical protein
MGEMASKTDVPILSLLPYPVRIFSCLVFTPSGDCSAPSAWRCGCPEARGGCNAGSEGATFYGDAQATARALTIESLQLRVAVAEAAAKAKAKAKAAGSEADSVEQSETYQLRAPSTLSPPAHGVGGMDILNQPIKLYTSELYMSEYHPEDVRPDPVATAEAQAKGSDVLGQAFEFDVLSQLQLDDPHVTPQRPGSGQHAAAEEAAARPTVGPLHTPSSAVKMVAPVTRVKAALDESADSIRRARERDSEWWKH